MDRGNFGRTASTHSAARHVDVCSLLDGWVWRHDGQLHLHAPIWLGWDVSRMAHPRGRDRSAGGRRCHSD